MKNILVALDLNESDSDLIKQAHVLASKFEAKVWFIHIAAPEPDFVGYDVGPQYIRDSRAETLKSEHRQLQKYMLDFEKEGLASEALLIEGPTIETLREEVEKLKVDLLIMGSHKHGFLYDTFIGNSASKLINHISIPLLIVPLNE